MRHTVNGYSFSQTLSVTHPFIAVELVLNYGCPCMSLSILFRFFSSSFGVLPYGPTDVLNHALSCSCILSCCDIQNAPSIGTLCLFLDVIFYGAVPSGIGQVHFSSVGALFIPLLSSCWCFPGIFSGWWHHGRPAHHFRYGFLHKILCSEIIVAIDSPSSTPRTKPPPRYSLIFTQPLPPSTAPIRRLPRPTP